MTQSQDPRVKSAIAHWAPRFVANGVALADFEEVTASIAAWDDWCRAWSARAAVHEAMGRAALAEQKLVSAGEHLQRAAVYYHFAKFVFVHDPAQMKAAHMKAVELRRLALPHIRPPGERVEIPYEGKSLFGILRKPVGAERPPVVMMAPGLDSTKEEMDAYEQPFLARGMATLAFDGPGQGEAEYDFPIRGDYEVAATAVFDWLQTRRDVDAGRAGLWGVSLGGYYAPRAAAFEKRVKACIALAGPFEWIECWDALPELTREAFRVRSHCATLGRCPPPRRDAVAHRRRIAHHLSDLHRHRQARPAHSVAARRAAGGRGLRAGRAADHRGRQPRRQQPCVPLPPADRRLDGRATEVVG